MFGRKRGRHAAYGEHALPAQRDGVEKRLVELIDATGRSHWVTFNAMTQGRHAGVYDTACCHQQVPSGALTARAMNYCPYRLPLLAPR